MKKYLVIAILLIVGTKLGVDYILSEKFQSYGDQKKAVWTCYVNNFIGNLYLIMSRYKEAHQLFSRSYERCPESACSEESAFKVAESLDGMGHRKDAAEAYEKFIETYGNSRRARIARKAIDILKF